MPPLLTPIVGTLADALKALPHELKTGTQLTEITWIIYGGSLVVLGYLIKLYHFCLANGSPNISLATYGRT
jgi:hypothetical protein